MVRRRAGVLVEGRVKALTIRRGARVLVVRRRRVRVLVVRERQRRKLV